MRRPSRAPRARSGAATCWPNDEPPPASVGRRLLWDRRRRAADRASAADEDRRRCPGAFATVSEIGTFFDVPSGSAGVAAWASCDFGLRAMKAATATVTASSELASDDGTLAERPRLRLVELEPGMIGREPRREGHFGSRRPDRVGSAGGRRLVGDVDGG